MKVKSETKHSLIVTNKELDAIQLAIGLMLEAKDCHPYWKKTLGPIFKQMRSALPGGDLYEPIEGL